MFIEGENLFDCQSFESESSLSPSINPGDLNLQPSMYQPQAMSANLAAQQQQLVQQYQSQDVLQQELAAQTTAALLASPTPSSASDSASPSSTVSADAAPKRYATRVSKRKLESEEEPAARPTHAAPTAMTQSTTTTCPRRIPFKARDSSDSGVLGPRKTAHNMIEKRYRTNLNDKILQLRDSVPCLRVMAQRARAAEEGFHGSAEPEDTGADDVSMDFESSTTTKLHKATILSKAAEYIHELQHTNQGLRAENVALRDRMQALEIMLFGKQAAAARLSLETAGEGFSNTWN
jgi:hypothetical protein